VILKPCFGGVRGREYELLAACRCLPENRAARHKLVGLPERRDVGLMHGKLLCRVRAIRADAADRIIGAR